MTKNTRSPTSLLHDRAGNIVFDGAFFLQYDAFNRLVQVNQAGTLVYSPADPSNDDFEDDGRIKADSASKVGNLVVRYTYDGLGRLIQKHTPTQPSNPASPMRTEDYYHDGVRRLQENVTTPDGQGGSTTETDRQYIYGPDYVDEFVAQTLDALRALPGDRSAIRPDTRRDAACQGQIDKGDAEHPDGRVFYMLQDANYNVVALMGLVDSTWQVVEQYTYEPYGAVVAKDDLSPGNHPINRVGHQGLFYEHLDAADGLTVGAIGLYYNRNRWYSPALGRFVSRDPNATAMPIITALAMNGQSVRITKDWFIPRGQYHDGMNLYQYVRDNPVIWRDPAGTMSLGSLGSAVGIGARVYGMYCTTTSFIGAIQDIANGVSLRSVILDFALDMAMDYVGGKALDYLVDVARPLIRRASRRVVCGLTGKHDPGPGYGFLDEPGIRERHGTPKQQLGYHDHHGFPQERRDDFFKLGIDVDNPDFVFTIDGENHLSVIHGAGQYNKIWDEFFEGRRGPITKQNAMDLLFKLAQKGFVE